MRPRTGMRRFGMAQRMAGILAVAAVLGVLAADAAPRAPAAGAAPAQGSQPTVTILSPGDGEDISSGELVVKLAVRVPDGSSLVGLRVLIDGRLAVRERGIALTAPATGAKDQRATHTLTVPVPSHDCVLSVLAETVPTRSSPASARLRWRGLASATQPAASPQSKMYVLAIGVSEYRQPDLRLRFAAKDARDLAATFKAQTKILYRAVETKLLLDQQASKSNILDGLEWLQRQTTAKDIAVLFLAGHGLTDPSTGGYYFLPYDADVAALKRTMISESEIRDTLAAISGKVLLFLDSCHSGKVFAGNQTRDPGGLSAFITELASAESGVIVFAASTGRQSSQEALAWNNGAFTKALVEGLSGRADTQKTGRVTHTMLDLYISERVKELTDGRQTPTTAKPATIPDFPIALVRELRDDDVDLVR